MMHMFRFDQAELTRNLDKLRPSLRVIFAAACAERLLPAYTTFAYMARQGEPETIKRILACLWADVSGEMSMGYDVQASIDVCMALIPFVDFDGTRDNDVYSGVETAYAEDAVSAVVYALTCRQGSSSQEAMWAAMRACEAVGYFATHRDEVDMKPGAASRVYAHPLIQAELARQCRDVDELIGIDDEDTRQIATRFRERAKVEAKILFGAPS